MFLFSLPCLVLLFMWPNSRTIILFGLFLYTRPVSRVELNKFSLWAIVFFLAALVIWNPSLCSNNGQASVEGYCSWIFKRNDPVIWLVIGPIILDLTEQWLSSWYGRYYWVLFTRVSKSYWWERFGFWEPHIFKFKWLPLFFFHIFTSGNCQSGVGIVNS